jgi:hypothetical protein
MGKRNALLSEQIGGIESEMAAGADIQDKLYWVNDDMPMLVSGDVTRSIELRDAYKVLLDSWGKENPPKRVTRANIRSFV